MQELMSKYSRSVRLALLGCAAGVAWAAWKWAPYKVLVAASMSVSQTCLIAATAVWALRERAEDTVPSSYDTAASVASAGALVRDVLQPMFVRRAAWSVVMVGLVGIPATTAFASKEVWEWSVYLACVGVAECAYSFMLASHWHRQLRQHKADRALEAIRRKEHIERLKAIESTLPSKLPVQDWTSPVEAVPNG